MFLFLYQIHTINKNLNDKGILISHLWWVNYIIKNLFHDKNNKTCFREKNSDRKTLTKPVPRKSHFVIAKLRTLIGYKDKNIRNYLHSVNLSRQQVLFFSWICVFHHWQSHRVLLRTPSSKTPVKHEFTLFDNLHIWLNLVCFNFCIIIKSYVCLIPLHYCWFCYNQKQSSSGAFEKRCS